MSTSVTLLLLLNIYTHNVGRQMFCKAIVWAAFRTAAPLCSIVCAEYDNNRNEREGQAGIPEPHSRMQLCL
jgi:hypothetical protein